MKPRVNLRLDPKLHAHLGETAASRRVSKTDVLEEALSLYFDPERNLAVEDRVMKELKSFERRMGQLEYDMQLSLETLGHYIFYWLVRTDPLPEQERDMAHALGQRRFDHFINQVARKLKDDGGLVERAKR
ncbi:hypothetical protein [Henriciella aquimarina]|uniref:hypothetical protein n=1 Tax=Henriciella aquimarina TaxID=545261 RepID=UPI0009FD0510|nr:hypothetical protein [Henriciella aquimarina]